MPTRTPQIADDCNREGDAAPTCGILAR
jgi:hypothetical protein